MVWVWMRKEERELSGTHCGYLGRNERCESYQRIFFGIEFLVDCCITSVEGLSVEKGEEGGEIYSWNMRLSCSA